MVNPNYQFDRTETCSGDLENAPMDVSRRRLFSEGLEQGTKASFESGLYCPIGQRRTSTNHTFSVVVFPGHRDVGHELFCPLWRCSHFQFLKGKCGLSLVAHTFNAAPKRQR